MQALLDKPADTELRRLTSQALARVNLRAGTHDMFSVDAQGQMLAECWPANGRQPAGSWLLHPLRYQQHTVGTVVLKLNLAPLEATRVDLGLRRLAMSDLHEVHRQARLAGARCASCCGPSRPCRKRVLN